MIEKGQVYRHFKDNYYKIIARCKHTETMEFMIVYQALYGDNEIWCRPEDMFCDKVEYNGKLVNRFTLMENYDGQQI